MPQTLPKLRLGTRGSALARAQAELVCEALGPHAVCEIVTVKTTGDRIQDRPLADAGGKGLFVKELEEALLRDEIDLAVHSLKDMPPDQPDALAIAACLPREDPRDAFLSNSAKTISELPKAARIGTSSVRRKAQVARMRGDLQILPLRGNVDTRLRKLDAGDYDAMLLAVAGLRRLGVAERITEILAADRWLPALCQGAIGIQIRKEDARTKDTVAKVNHATTGIVVACERAFGAALGGSCTSAIGGLATFSHGVLKFSGEVLAPDGSDFISTGFEATLKGDHASEAAALGRKAGESIRARAAQWLDL